MSNQKLELTWIGKDQRSRLEPRILLEDPKRSYHASTRVTDNDLFDNRLIKDDKPRPVRCGASTRQTMRKRLAPTRGNTF